MKKIKNILFINSPTNDYLPDSILIGLKNDNTLRVLEYPEINQAIYRQENVDMHKIYGRGFTLYNLLDAQTAEKYVGQIDYQNIDLFIFGSIYRQYNHYLELKPYLRRDNTLILDGEDFAALFPFHYPPFKQPYPFLKDTVHKHFIYYKRELIIERTIYYRYYKLIPKFWAQFFPLPKNVYPIGFSIPSVKIITQKTAKSKLFPKHIVDVEIANKIPNTAIKYAFDNEEAYYQDLQQSKFGITTKRGGWDCMRHYEIAANGAVICFKNLDKKDLNCAPHGLIPRENCISYKNYQDLITQIEQISDTEYTHLQTQSLQWIQKQTCEIRAKELLNYFIKAVESPKR